jgi:membrane fusion protein (multidrug efflux system)
MFISSCRINSLILGFILSYCCISNNALAQTPDISANISDSLPGSLDSNSIASMNTPEYVIIRSSDEATFSSETAASVALLPVKEGSIFHKNDILLALDCRIQGADLKKAQAQQQAANKAYESALKLKFYGSISEFEVSKARAESAGSNAEVDKLLVVVEKCIIKAPFNGSVAELMVHPHESVKPGDPLLKIVNTDNLDFAIQVPSVWLKWLRVGAPLEVHINEIGKTISAKITLINPQIEPVSQTVKIVGTITPRNEALRPGMSGQAVFLDNPNKKRVTP